MSYHDDYVNAPPPCVDANEEWWLAGMLRALGFLTVDAEAAIAFCEIERRASTSWSTSIQDRPRKRKHRPATGDNRSGAYRQRKHETTAYRKARNERQKRRRDSDIQRIYREDSAAHGGSGKRKQGARRGSPALSIAAVPAHLQTGDARKREGSASQDGRKPYRLPCQNLNAEPRPPATAYDHERGYSVETEPVVKYRPHVRDWKLGQAHNRRSRKAAEMDKLSKLID
jgi:hypothetical protein